MDCPHCRTSNPLGAVDCLKCRAPLGDGAATLVAEMTPPTGSGGKTPGRFDGSADATLDRSAPSLGTNQTNRSGTGAWDKVSRSSASIESGAVIANRYEIIERLGEGGMGAVYKVRDREVDRFAALKIIRPELADRPDILQRFKQELILARQVTHKNVIRIFDLGEADGVKFITMDFVEGQNLKSILEQKGKFAPEEAIRIVTQICRALDAAHSEGVVHRDLKPQNIMLDAKGRVTVMDFGIARSVEMSGMTQTGALVGTPEYMSPEQAKGEEVDARSDLFTLGIIFYELLTGATPFGADTVYAMLLKRTQQCARPPIELDPTIPPQINNVVVKCLEIDRDQRYSSALEIIHDLGQPAATITRTLPAAAGRAGAGVAAVGRYRKWIVAGVGGVTLLGLGLAFRGRLMPERSRNSPGGAIVSLLILPFRNASGDPTLDWLGKSLAEMLRTDVGQSENFRTVPPERLRQILSDLHVADDAEIDPGTVGRIAEFTNADQVVSGQYVRAGDQIRIDARLENLKAQQTTPIKVQAANEKALLDTVDQLAKALQDNLTLSPQTVKQMKTAAFTPSSKSVEALRDYDEGLELSRQGNFLEAVKRFEAATSTDPNFALAYTKLGEADASLGYDKQAEQYSGKAVDLSRDLPPAEKYWIQATNAQIQHNYPKAIEAYQGLAKLLPGDPQVQFNLSGLYEDQGDFDHAQEHIAKVLELDPQYVDALRAIGRLQIKRGNPQASLDPLNRALSLAVQLDDKQEKAAVQQALGIAYGELHKPDDALQSFEESLSLKRQIGDKRGMAASLGEVAQIQAGQGKPDQARSSYEEALTIQKQIGDKQGIGLTLMNMGDLLLSGGHYQEALAASKQALQIEQDLGDENFQAICLNNIGTIDFNQGQYDDARTYFKQALELREKLNVPADIAQTVSNLGETASKMGRFDEALSSYLRALDLWRKVDDKRGIATTSDGMAVLFEYQGRFGAALGAQEEALRIFQQLQDRSSTLAEIQANYGNALSLVGRYEDAQKNLDQALVLARQLQDNPLQARILNFQGDQLFYRGDFNGARPQYDQALQLATRANDRYEILLAKFNQAKLSVKQGRGGGVLNELRAIARDADSIGLKFLSTQCSVYLGEALIANRDYAHARAELEAATQKSQDLGMRALLAQANYLMSLALRASGDASEASRHQQQAVSLLDEIHKESKSDALYKRKDLEPIAQAAGRSLAN